MKATRRRAEPDLFRCNDMALVSYLKINGHSPQEVYWEPEGSTVYWNFFIMPSLMDLIERFHSGEALVEPKEYNRLFQQTKRELYAQADPHRK